MGLIRRAFDYLQGTDLRPSEPYDGPGSEYNGDLMHDARVYAQKYEREARALPEASDRFGFAGSGSEDFAPPEYGNYIATSSGVYAAARIRATLLSSLPLKLYVVSRTGSRKELTAGDERDLFDSVNGFWTFRRLMEMSELSLALWGKNYWFVERTSRRGRPRNIWWARPDRVKVVPHPTDYVSHFLYRPPGASQDIRFEREETFWTRFANPLDEYEGLSPLAAARLSADTMSAAMKSNRNMFANGLKPGGFVFPDTGGKFTQEQRKAIQEGLNRDFKGTPNAHRWGVFTESVKFQQPLSPKDAEFIEGLHFSLEEICRAYGVPLDLLGGQRTYANVEASERIIWTQTIVPEARFFAAEITEQILPMFGRTDLVAEFDTEDVSVLKESENDAWKRTERQIHAGTVTINEWRTEKGMKPVAWGDAWWVQTAGGGYAPVSGPNAPIAANQEIQFGGTTVNEYREAKGLPPVPWGDEWWTESSKVPISGDENPDAKQLPPPTIKELPPGEDGSQDTQDGQGGAERAHRVRRTRAVAYGSPEHERRHQRFVSQTEPHEQAVAATTASLFRRQKQAILAKLREQDVRRVGADGQRLTAKDLLSAIFALPRWISEFRVAIRPVFRDLITDLGQQALDELEMGIAFDISDPNVTRFLEQRAQRFAREINDTTWQALKASLGEGLEAGEGIDDLARRVESVMGDRIRSSGEVIARTETASVASGGAEISWIQSGVVQGKEWLAALDQNTRPSHAEAHGQTRRLGEDFQVGGATGPGPGNMGSADEDANCRCFPGDTPVYAEDIEAASMRWYEGDVVKLTLFDGSVLTTTPNHPLLTPSGWVAAGALNLGSDLIGYVLSEDTVSPNPDPQHGPTSFDEVFRALLLAGVPGRIAGRAPQFHGDGMNGEVDIVWPDRQLRDGIESPRPKPIADGVFSEADAAERRGSLNNAGRAGILRESLAFVGIGRSHTNNHRAVPASGGDASLYESQAHAVAADAERGGQRLLRLSGDVSDDQADGVDGFTLLQIRATRDGLATGANGDSRTLQAGIDDRLSRVHSPSDGRRRLAPNVAPDDFGGIDVRALPGSRLPSVRFAERPSWDASSGEALADRPNIATEIARDGVCRRPGLVTIYKVICIQVEPFCGHVYNLHTRSGHYLANGIIAHNCTIAPVLDIDEPRAASSNGQDRIALIELARAMGVEA